MRLLSLLGTFVFSALAFGIGGCTHNVGDHCATNVDCSALGDRFCDLSAPRSEPGDNGDQGGYCTVEGCDVQLDANSNLKDSCPDEAVCVRFFIQTMPACFDNADTVTCGASAQCLCDCSRFVPTATDPAHTECDTCPGVTPPMAPDPTDPTMQRKILGHCAAQTSERRWCMKRCDKDADCRGSNYECRAAGTNGAELVPGEPNVSKFCVAKATAK